MNRLPHEEPFTNIRFRLARISDRTLWAFVELHHPSGVVGVGEATLPGRERALIDAALDFLPGCLSGMALRPVTDGTPLPIAALRTALDVAAADAAARMASASLANVLGNDSASRVPLYANINRRTRDRSAPGFAASARHAVDRGFDAVKIAPFDEVLPEKSDDTEGRRSMDIGLERIAAVRAEIGPSRKLLVDCHWRFGDALSRALVEAVRPFDLHWLECPIVEEEASIPALAALRGRLNSFGVRLAGLEEFSGRESFLRYARAGAYDVMMPDMKYVGGIAEMQRTAVALADLGVEVSPHNPTGPICHAASLHLCAGLPGFTMLELQLDETPWFWSLATPALPPVDGGVSALPAGAGLGIGLDHQQLAPLVTLDLSFQA